MPKILITGALGQIGSELIELLRSKYGTEQVVASDIRRRPADMDYPYEYLDVTDAKMFAKLVVDHEIDWLINLAGILSATGERNPQLAMQVNIRGFETAVEVARQHKLRILSPSSIAAFGPSTPAELTPDLTIMRPTTIYGISKVYIELLGEYYHDKWGVDFRSLRYPGIISSKTLPGGGTTDYAVEIFYEAIKKKAYTCFLSADTALPMMHMDDCLKGTIQLLEADPASLEQRTFNLAAMSFTPAQLATEIQKHMPEFHIDYQPDYRQQIADSWPSSIDDQEARRQWGWQHQYDLPELVDDMLREIGARLS